MVLLIASAALFGTGCEPEPVQTRFLTPEESGAVARSELTLTLSAEQVPGGTKASLLRDVEQKGSGALVLVFRSDTRQLDSYRFFTQEEIRNQDRVPLRLRVPLTRCDFYILGNLNAVHKTETGRLENLMEALGEAFPVDEQALESFVYRLDGGELNGAWRRERFADVAACGIPYMHVQKDVDTAEQIAQGRGIPGSDQCRRLFSKVTVRIDHAAFDGGGADPGVFVNSRLYLRQANARLQPFSAIPQKAEVSGDVLLESDYDPDMAPANASVTTFSFYVPENMQGTLLPDNADSRKKTPDELGRKGLGARAAYLTYVEFVGRLDPGAGGYGGDVTYRFYLGDDNCSNFDLVRGREYEISLTFRVGSLFEPDWKVEPSHWNDSRLFCLTGDPGFADRLPEGRVLAVRANRPGGLYVYMNPDGTIGARNALLGREALGSPSFVPESLADCAWYGSFFAPGSADQAWLAERGITPSWDRTAGRLVFTVSDRTRLAAHIGESRPLTLTLCPNGTSTTFTLKLLPDIAFSVADGLSLTDEFYLGQKRTVRVSGFVGSDIRYAADQDGCGRTAGAAHTQNVQWKSTPAASAAFPSCAVDAGGSVALRVPDPAYASQRYVGSLDIYAFYPNRFQPSHAGWTSRNGKIIFFSEDTLNDTLEVPIRISEPRLLAPEGDVYLPIDGNEVPTELGYMTFNGSARVPGSSFDPALFASLMGVRLQAAAGSDGTWLPCVTLAPEAGNMYVSQTNLGASLLEEESKYSRINGAYCRRLGRVRIVPHVLTDLFGTTENFNLYVTKLNIDKLRSGIHCIFDDGYSVFQSDYFNTNPSSQLEDDTSFSMSAEYSFINGDLTRIDWTRTGKAMTYSCKNSVEKVSPVIDFVVDIPDTGRGGTFSWVYDEARQVFQSSTGEPVPGGLILPYDTQTMTGTITNKWDGRSFTVSVSFDLSYPVITANLLVVAPAHSVNASVYLMPYKITKYLRRIGDRVDKASRHWMMQLFERSDWMDYVYSYNRYQTQSGISYWHSPGRKMGMPLTDFNVHYLWDFLNESTGETVWTPNAVNRLSSYYPSSICNSSYVDFNSYQTRFFHQLNQDSSQNVVGLYWKSPEEF